MSIYAKDQAFCCHSTTPFTLFKVISMNFRDLGCRKFATNRNWTLEINTRQKQRRSPSKEGINTGQPKAATCTIMRLRDNREPTTLKRRFAHLFSPSATRSRRVLPALLTVFIYCSPLIASAEQGKAVPASTAETAIDSRSKGLKIATTAKAVDAGFGDSTADMVMILLLSADQEIEREMRQLSLEVSDDGDKSILVFDRPRDLKGTAILTHSHRIEADDQWLFLPALKRVKRISSADKSGPFMGSEFAYEDLSSQEVEKFRYNYLRDELLDNQPCFVVERIPKDPKSGYSKQVVWFDQLHYRPMRITYYDRKGDLLKTMHLLGYQQYLNKFWRPEEMQMENHQTGKQTILLFSNYAFQVGLDDSDFTRNALSRTR